MAKQILRWTGKALLAGLLALALLCGFCFFYYNVPVHYPNPSGATEYVWEASRFYSRGTEGFAMGRTNNEGFNNLLDHSSGDPVDLLLMGSSHMEGFNVAQEECAAAVLNRLLAGRVYTYSIGTAGHTLPYCVKHLDAALREYAPSRYVLLETTELALSPEDMESAVSGTLADIPSHSGGFVGLLQKLPFLRLFYTKFVKNAESFGDIDAASTEEEQTDAAAYEAALARFLGKLARESRSHGVQALIVYSPFLEILPDGGARAKTDPEQLAVFSRLCEEEGIAFLDLGSVYLEAYSHDALPVGFSNTPPCAGHLNRIGHRLFAESVAAWIEERGA